MGKLPQFLLKIGFKIVLVLKGNWEASKICPSNDGLEDKAHEGRQSHFLLISAHDGPGISNK